MKDFVIRWKDEQGDKQPQLTADPSQKPMYFTVSKRDAELCQSLVFGNHLPQLNEG
ncbi:hypothetical protein [Pacificibacter maritimus]|uniref:hypothetical protein n=1 Tax=Pacificibacter maritimus TaxID=762213 RepID=UPI0014753BAB|nr:hypothetical protein [Pacificibacter maritimus]